MFQITIFIIGLLLLLLGADIFVDGAVGIAFKQGVSSLFVGLTLVAMGTSLPETAVSMMASVNQNGGIAVGNVLGSNILNILIILGLCAWIRPLIVAKSTIYIEIPFLIFVSFITGLIGLDLEYTLLDGIIFLLLFAIYLLYLFYLAQKGKEINETEEGKNIDNGIEVGREIITEIEVDKEIEAVITKKVSYGMIKYLMLILFGLVLVILGSRMTVSSATKLAKYVGISDRVIGLTVVALGTSLPELSTSIIATLKNKPDIAVGNIVGSNIFNILFVLGISCTINPISFQNNFFVDAIVMIAVTVLLWLFAIRKRELTKTMGIIFLILVMLYWGQVLGVG